MAAANVSVLVKSAVPHDETSRALLQLGLFSSCRVTPLMPAVAAASPGAGQGSCWFQVRIAESGLSGWDLCHALLGAADPHPILLAEPDLLQNWRFDESGDLELAALKQHDSRPQSPRFPPHLVPSKPVKQAKPDHWYADAAHGNFSAALKAWHKIDPASRDTIRIAHIDTGYDPDLADFLPPIDTANAESFFDGTKGSADQIGGLLANRGHGTGTLGLLGDIAGHRPGSAANGPPLVEVVPLRVANRAVTFSNSAVAGALDHVLALCAKPESRIDIVMMPIGGLASQAWAEAINALYEAGVLVVASAGNNFANRPTRSIAFPARFGRAVAACGVMADGKPYANLDPSLMAGNFGPASAMASAMAAFTPNLPWLRLGGGGAVDKDGAGTSPAAPQIAAAAAFWLSRHRRDLPRKPDWRRVEAIRTALFSGARHHRDSAHVGRGVVDALSIMQQPVPALDTLEKQPPDSADCALLQALSGIKQPCTPREHMLQIEALQLSQHWTIEAEVRDPQDLAGLPDDLATARALLVSDSRSSKALRQELTQRAEPAKAEQSNSSTHLKKMRAEAQVRLAKAPPVPAPRRRKLRIFSTDPAMTSGLDTYARAATTIDIPWEPLLPGPIGEYLEVIDIDPASHAGYAPVNLDDPALLPEHGLAPTETDPRFHQQMVYAVASRTIEQFEKALGRSALWAPHRDPGSADMDGRFVPRLRIYPHGLRTMNAYYSPPKKALLLGYFQSQVRTGREDAGRPTVFSAISHDIIAHETAHALLDGLHRRFIEDTNLDCLAFHEAFADIVALFQHFTMPDAVRAEIAATRGDLLQNNRLGELAYQFGRSMGQRGALRSYIGSIDADGTWHPNQPTVDDYGAASEPHDRGAVLVSAVFDAFLQIYDARARKLFKLASGGSGLLEPGELMPALVDELAATACGLAASFLNITIRALDYCPPFDLTFGEFLRAMITADCDLVPDDPEGFRVALAAAFRARGISPANVRSVTPNALAWEAPDAPPEALDLTDIVEQLEQERPGYTSRRESFNLSRGNAARFHEWLVKKASADQLALFGIECQARPMTMRFQRDGKEVCVSGNLRGPEVHSLRTLRRVGPDRTVRNDLIIELTQSWVPDVGTADALPGIDKFRGGCTIIVDRASRQIKYVLVKRVTNARRLADQSAYRSKAPTGLHAAYFKQDAARGEPFAMLHSCMFE